MGKIRKSYYEDPDVTVDTIVFTVDFGDLKVLLIKRKQDPHKGIWAIPGGFIRKNEELEAAALRELEEETNVKPNQVYLEQLYTFSSPKRDPRGRIITVTYIALVHSKDINDLKATSDAESVNWHSIYDLPELAFDHKEILEYALQRLRYKLEYTTAAFRLLPKEFTLSQLQAGYEIILNRELDKRNFRKKIFALNLIKDTGKTQKEVRHRPAKLFTARKSIGEIVEIIQESSLTLTKI